MIKNLFILSCLALFNAGTAVAGAPQLKLPWGTYEAEVYKEDSKLYLFQNVRFGANPPRFGKPSFPRYKNSSVQDSSYSTSCIQISPQKANHPPGGSNPLVGKHDNDNVVQQEDCLFLDIYVPRSAFEKRDKQLPVIVWIHGGAYAFGSKKGLYPLDSGKSILHAADYEAIYIAGNYRLGAYGWLAGDYMQEAGQPNAGLYDQALLFEWVQEYVDQVKGDRKQVSAWGESAGAGSILHHLVRDNGRKDPLFQSYVTMSPAFEWSWDNSPDGTLDAVYKQFSDLSGCGEHYNITCLREKKCVRDANQQLFDTVRKTGLFPVGPAVDDKWIKTIPTVAFSNGDYWRHSINSAIISHSANEAAYFTPKVYTSWALDKFLEAFLPGSHMDSVRNAIKKQYGCRLLNYQTCLANIIRDVSFTCNTRDLFDAYPEKSYVMEYAFPFDSFAVHATDLIPMFVNSFDEAFELLLKLLPGVHRSLLRDYAKKLVDYVQIPYQSYFASFAVHGDPNKHSEKGVPYWGKARQGEKISDVLRVGSLKDHIFTNISDVQNTKQACNFWLEVANNLVESTRGFSDGELLDSEEL